MCGPTCVQTLCADQPVASDACRVGNIHTSEHAVGGSACHVVSHPTLLFPAAGSSLCAA